MTFIIITMKKASGTRRAPPVKTVQRSFQNLFFFLLFFFTKILQSTKEIRRFIPCKSNHNPSERKQYWGFCVFRTNAEYWFYCFLVIWTYYPPSNVVNVHVCFYTKTSQVFFSLNIYRTQWTSQVYIRIIVCNFF